MEMKIFVSAVNPNVSPKCEICYSMLSKQDEKADRWDVLPSGKPTPPSRGLLRHFIIDMVLCTCKISLNTTTNTSK